MDGIVFSSFKSKKQPLSVKPLSVLRELIMAVLLIWLMCPYQNFFGNWYIYGGLWIGWIIIAFMTDPTAFRYMAFSKYTWVALSWPCSIFLLSLVDWADFSPYQFTIVLVVSAFVYYAKGNHVKALRFLIAVYVAYAIMISAFSIQQLQINPEISRLLANSDKNITSAFAGPFMANFSFVNGLTLVSLFWVFNLKTTHNKRIRLFSLLMVVIGIYLLVCAQYSIALFLFVIFAFIVWMFNSKRQRSSSTKVFFLVFGLLILLPFAGNILLSLSDMIPPGYVARRLKSLGMMLNFDGIQQGSDLEDRMQLYKLSISTFFHNFFIGVGGKYYGANGLVGGHSQILDNFAYYGILFGGQFVWYLVCSFKNGEVFLKNDFKHTYKVIFIVYMIQCLLNTSYNEEMLFTIFFIVPSLIYLAQYDRIKVGMEAKS